MFFACRPNASHCGGSIYSKENTANTLVTANGIRSFADLQASNQLPS